MERRFKFTEESVAALPFAEKGERVTYRDTEDKRLYLNVSHRSKTFLMVKKALGRTFYVTLHAYTPLSDSVKRARQAAGAKAAELMGGKDVAMEKRENAKKERARRKDEEAKKYTLKDALKDYLEGRPKLKPSTVDNYTRLFDLYLSDWLQSPLADITGDTITKRHKEIATKKRDRDVMTKEVVTKTVKGEEVQVVKRTAVKEPVRREAAADGTMRVLRAVLNFAFAGDEENGRVRVNPVAMLSKKKTWFKVARRRNLIKSSDLPRWYKAVNALENPHMRDFLLFLLFTGLRRNEGARLKWSQVDFEEKAFTIVDTKNKEPHTLPMSSQIYDLLKNRHDTFKINSYVFPGAGPRLKGDGTTVCASSEKAAELLGCIQEPKRAIDAVTAATGIIFSCHDLRRTFATIAESLDLSRYTIKALLNHKQETGDVTGGYIQINVDRLREPMQKVCDAIEERIKKQHGQVAQLGQKQA
jgi:integrase